MSPIPPGYFSQLSTMRAQLCAWMAARPEVSPKVQWNFPQSVAVIAPITDALAAGLVCADAEGLEMLRAMGHGFTGTDCEPTVFMCRMVIESIGDDTFPLPGKGRHGLRPERPGNPCPGCGEIMSGALSLDGSGAPLPGRSVAICVCCGALNTYDEQLRLVPLPEALLEQLKADKEAWAMVEVALAAFTAKPKAGGASK